MTADSGTLLVCAAPVPGADDYYARLIRGFANVVAVDAGAAVCIGAGRVPDVLIGDFDSLAPELLAELRAQDVEHIGYPAEKDMTDLDLALRLMEDRLVRHVTVTAAWGMRLDHTLAALGSVCRYAHLLIDLADPTLAGWVMDATHRSDLALQGANATVSLMAIEHAAVVSCEGMRYELRRDTLAQLSSWGLSNVISEEAARIRVHAGTLLVLSETVSNNLPARFLPSGDAETF